MISFTFSTVLMTFLTSGLLILIIDLCFHWKNVLLSIGYKPMALLIIIAALRLIMPFELPWCRNVYMNAAFSRAAIEIQQLHHTHYRAEVSVWYLFECIWICGTMIRLLKLCLSNHEFERYIARHGMNVTSKEPYNLYLNKITEGHTPQLQIYLLPGLKTPQQSGIFHPRILLPTDMNFSDTELYYALYHEAEHARRKHTLLKQASNILKALYWWNPFVYRLSRQIDITIELCVDSTFAQKSYHVKKRYVDTLMHVVDQAKRLTESGQPPKGDCRLLNSFSVPIVGGNIQDIEKRLPMIYKQKKIFAPLVVVFISLALVLYSASYSFIFEAFYATDNDVVEINGRELTLDRMYAVESPNGTYDIYWGSTVIDHCDSLEYYPLVPVTEQK